MFINQYASTPENGYAGRSYYFARSLQMKGHKVLLVASANHHLLRNKPKFNGIWAFETHHGLNILWIKTLNYKAANSPIRVVNWFLFLAYMPFLSLLKLKPSIIHYSSPSPVGFIGVWILSKLIAAKTCLDIRDVWPETLISIGNLSRKHPIIRMLYWIEKFSAKKADKISSNLANYSFRLAELGIHDRKFIWIPNGVSVEDIEYSHANSTVLLPEYCRGKFVVAYTGTLGEANALDHVLHVADILSDHRDIIFLFVGHGHELNNLVKISKDKGLKNVFFHQAVIKKDIYKLQSLCNVLCVGAKASSLYKYGVSPNKLFEYMFSGVPIIYYIDSPLYNPVIDAGCGIEISSNDPDEFSQAILEIKGKSCDELERMAKSGIEYAKKNHIYSSLVEKLLF